MKEQDENIHLRSDRVKDIIGYIPSWIILWGNTVILILIFILVAGLYFIKYPDIIYSEITITTPDPPSKIIARKSGKVTELFVKDNDVVKNEQVLGIIENTADFKDVMWLKKEISNFSKLKTFDFDSCKSLRLGELEQAFGVFEQSLKEYLLQIKLTPEVKEINILNRQIQEYKSLLSKQNNQLQISKEELLLLQKDYTRNKELYAQKVLSGKEFDDKQREYLQEKRKYENLRIDISTTNISINELIKSLSQQEVKEDKTKNNLERELEENLRHLNVAILSWEQSYLLKSPIDGKVSFFSIWSLNQVVRESEVVFMVVPSNVEKIIGRLIMPIRNSGKVKEGNVVNICLESFPCEEWGNLKGRVKSISLVPRDGKYAIEVELIEGLTTTYERKLDFKQEMQGKASVITSKMRLIDRIINPLRQIGEDY